MLTRWIATPVMNGLSSEFAVLPDGRALWQEETGGRSRLAIVVEGKAPVPFSSTTDETTFPRRDHSQGHRFPIGREGRTVGIASTETGKITRRIALDKSWIRAIFASPDGQTLYCDADGQEQETPVSGVALPYINSTGAIRNGKLLQGLQAPKSWFLDPAVIDLATGEATRIPIETVENSFGMAWTPEDRCWRPSPACSHRCGNFSEGPNNDSPDRTSVRQMFGRIACPARRCREHIGKCGKGKMGRTRFP
jgi:hypothetical protein